MIQNSAAARNVRFAACATIALTFAISVALVRGQDDSGPWIPPEGSVAGPSSDAYREVPRPDAGAYPSPGGDFGGAPPRQLAPVYRGPEGGAYSPQPAPVALPSFPDRPSTGRATDTNFPRTASAATPSGPSIQFPPTRRPAPLPPAERSAPTRGFDQEFDRSFVAPVGFDKEAAPETAGDASAPGDGAEAKRLLPPKPGPGEALKSSTGQFPYAATFGSLAAVLGGFFIFVWFQKRGAKRGSGALPPEVVEPLGTVPFVSRQALHVVRFGSKILLINVTTGGSETLAEIDDPREAERILALCRRHRPDPLGRTFREILGTPRPAASAPADRSRGAAHA